MMRIALASLTHPLGGMVMELALRITFAQYQTCKQHSKISRQITSQEQLASLL